MTCLVQIQQPSWGLNPNCVLHWRSWEEGYILFNAASGQTHFLNELGAAILKLFEQGAAPLDIYEIFEKLAASFDLIIDTPMQSYIGNLLVDLDGLGLIEPCNA